MGVSSSYDVVHITRDANSSSRVELELVDSMSIPRQLSALEEAIIVQDSTALFRGIPTTRVELPKTPSISLREIEE